MPEARRHGLKKQTPLEATTSDAQTYCGTEGTGIWFGILAGQANATPHREAKLRGAGGGLPKIVSRQQVVSKSECASSVLLNTCSRFREANEW